MEDNKIQAITVEDNIAKISVMEVSDEPGIAFKLFNKLAEADIRLESIVQNVNRLNVNDITFTVDLDQVEAATEITEKFAEENGTKDVVCDTNIARLSVVSAAAVASSSLVAKFFKALYEVGVNIQTISTSEVKISCVIDKSMAKEALKQVYKEFGTI